MKRINVEELLREYAILLKSLQSIMFPLLNWTARTGSGGLTQYGRFDDDDNESFDSRS